MRVVGFKQEGHSGCDLHGYAAGLHPVVDFVENVAPRGQVAEQVDEVSVTETEKQAVRLELK
jgi:hypothetical protein